MRFMSPMIERRYRTASTTLPRRRFHPSSESPPTSRDATERPPRLVAPHERHVKRHFVDVVSPRRPGEDPSDLSMKSTLSDENLCFRIKWLMRAFGYDVGIEQTSWNLK
jgi:hypothetical protein